MRPTSLLQHFATVDEVAATVALIYLMIQDGKVSSGKEELERAMDRYSTFCLPIPWSIVDGSERWLNPAVNLGFTPEAAAISGFSVSKPLPYDVWQKIEWFIGELRRLET